jgi:type I restriction enzyme S subunit
VLRLADVSTSGTIAASGLRRIPLPDSVSRRYSLQKGDLLAFRVNGSPGIAGQVVCYAGPEPHAYCDHFIRFRVDRTAIVPEFAAAAFRVGDVRRQVEEMMVSSAGQNTVSQASYRAVCIPLPPLAEQRRIVAKLEELLGKVGACQKRLAKVPALLRRFRQSVLAAACAGRLTAGWREEHPGHDAGPLASVLNRERQQLWERRELARRTFSAEDAHGDGWKRRYKPPHEPAGGGTDVPASWTRVTVSQLALLDVGFAFKSSEYADRGIRLLRGENLEPGRLRWDDTRFWPSGELESLEHFLIAEGEIILALDRPVVSTGLKIARATAADLPCLLVQRMMRFKMVRPELTQWLFCNLRIEGFIRHLSSGLTGSDLPHVTGTGVAEYALGLPPLPEQHEIVRRVEALFALADRIEARFVSAKAQVDRLTQALLAKAFRGDLVPQDPKDEPASVLLERIRDARSGGGQKTRRRGARGAREGEQ